MSWEKVHEILITHHMVVGWEWLRDDATDRPYILRIFWANGSYEDVTASTTPEAIRDKANKVKALGYPREAEEREA
jgi:hypothetical protein